MAGHIKQLSRGRFRVVVEAGKDPATGKRKRIVRYFEGRKEEAMDFMASLLAEVNKGTYVEPTDITVARWLENWIDGRTDLAPKTQEDYRGYIENHLVPSLGALTLDQLQPMHIENFKQEKLAAKLSANSVNHYLTVLHAALKHAVAMKVIRDNPATHVRRPKISKKEPRALTMDELRKLLDALAVKPWLQRICTFAAFTGLRRSEIFGLRWANVDIDNAQIFVKETKQRLIGKWVDKGPKSDAGLRSIPLTPELVKMLKDIKAEQEAAEQSKYQDQDLVFCQPNGTPIWPSNFTRQFRTIADEAGFKDFTFHGFRHTFATQLLKELPEINVAQALLGHEKPSTTLNMYGHVLPGRKEIAISKLHSAFGGHQTGTKKRPKRYRLKK
jgi:integrase